MTFKTQLCEPFNGVPTDLVPARGWSWAQLRNVPTVNKEGYVWSNEDLFHTFIANPCFSDALICTPPHWQGNPITSGKDVSTVFVAYIDKGHIISQHATKEGIYMFRRQILFIHCGDSLMLVQCGRCHMLSHYAMSNRCKAPKNSIKCYRCRGSHDSCKHDYECPQKHAVPRRCNCKLKCLLCSSQDHHCCSQKCPKHGPGPSGFAKLPKSVGTDESNFDAPKAAAPSQQKQQCKHTSTTSRVPYTNHNTAMTVPAGACVNNPEKSNICCDCCPLPSIVTFVNRYLGAPEPSSPEEA
jgi:hypothetical protein